MLWLHHNRETQDVVSPETPQCLPMREVIISGSARKKWSFAALMTEQTWLCGINTLRLCMGSVWVHAELFLHSVASPFHS